MTCSMPENGGNGVLHGYGIGGGGDAQAQQAQQAQAPPYDEAAMLRLLGGEDEAAAGQWEAPPPNLDQFFTRIYRWGGGGGCWDACSPCVMCCIHGSSSSPPTPTPAAPGRAVASWWCSLPGCSTCWPWRSRVCARRRRRAAAVFPGPVTVHRLCPLQIATAALPCCAVAMSALLLLYVDWGGLRAECLRQDTCDIWDAAVRRHPLAGGLTAWRGLAVAYLALFTAYCLVSLVRALVGCGVGLRESTTAWPALRDPANSQPLPCPVAGCVTAA